MKDASLSTAMEFLREHGDSALVSLGSGSLINGIDNHFRLFVALGLTHYIAVDIESVINARLETLFNDDATMLPLLAAHCDGEPQRFLEAIRGFPSTAAEQLFGLHCRVVVCQRVLPYLHWEPVIESMSPDLVLQEDLHGCEIQNLADGDFHRCRAGVRHFGLRPFRPWRIFPGEYNLVLWRNKHFSISREVDAKCRENRWIQFRRGFKGVKDDLLGHWGRWVH